MSTRDETNIHSIFSDVEYNLVDLARAPISTMKIKQFPMSDAQLNPTWSNPARVCSVTKYGCVIDSLTFLGILPKDVGEYLSRERTYIRKSGTYLNELFDLVARYYDDQFIRAGHRVHTVIATGEITDMDAYNRVIDYLQRTLSPGYSTLLSVSYNYNSATNKYSDGHTFVLAKKHNNELVIIDPQDNLVVSDIATYLSTRLPSSQYSLCLLYDNEYTDLPLIKTKYRKNIHHLAAWPVTQQMISDFFALNADKIPRNVAYDCYVNVLAFLKIIPRVFAEDISLHIHSQDMCVKSDKGRAYHMFFNAILEEVNRGQKFTVTTREFPMVNGDDLTFLTTYLNVELTPGTGTAVWLGRAGRTIGHCVVFARQLHAPHEIQLLDPQQMKVLSISEWTSYFTKFAIESVEVILKQFSLKRIHSPGSPGSQTSQNRHKRTRRSKSTSTTRNPVDSLTKKMTKLRISSPDRNLTDSLIEKLTKLHISSPKKTQKTKMKMRKTKMAKTRKTKMTKTRKS